MSEITLTDAQQYTPDTIQNLSSFAYLTQTQRIVLKVVLDGMSTDLTYTDTEIAEKAGVSGRTVWNCKQNAHFLSCLSQATLANAKSDIPLAIQKLKEIALKKGSVRAIDLWMRYTGDYIPKSQLESSSKNLNVNANIKPGEEIGAFIAILADQGMSRARIHEEIDAVYDELKAQGRII